MTITLPDEMREELEARAKAAGFASPDAYVASLLMEACDGEEFDEEIPDPPPGASYVVNSREELEAKLEESLKGGPSIPVTPQFWADLRKEVEQRVAAKKRRKS